MEMKKSQWEPTEAKRYRWEPIIYRPQLPDGWDCIEQIGNSLSCRTSFVRFGRIHHTDEPRRLWVSIIEFNPNRKENDHLLRYAVRGGLHIPNGKLKKFHNLKDAEAYLIYLINGTDMMIDQVNSKKSIDSYNKRMSEIKNRLEKEQNERTSDNAFI